MLRRAALAATVVALFVLGLFAAAGRWDWTQGWVYLAVLTIGNGISNAIVWRKNPGLLRRRGRFGEGTKGWDKIALVVFGLTTLLIMVVGALDGGRYRWSEMTPWLWPVGALLYGAGQTLVTWSMTVNPFFEKTARIQTDRGHRVIDDGPYRAVRHPGYAATIIGLVLGSPLMLGSWWAFLPALLAALGLVVRTALEDRMLMDELDGYRDYAARVPYRLVPRLW